VAIVNQLEIGLVVQELLAHGKCSIEYVFQTNRLEQPVNGYAIHLRLAGGARFTYYGQLGGLSGSSGPLGLSRGGERALSSTWR